jgi:two-component system response regulator HydG
LSAAVARRLLGHAWPGNVRELQNCMERAVAVSRGNEIALGDLPDSIVDQYQPSHPELFGVELSDVPESIPTMEEVERRYIRHVLTAVHGNKTLAAQCLGFDRRTLYRKLGRVYGADADGGVAQASRM